MNYPFKALIFLLIITISYEKTLNYIPSPSNYYEETNEDDSFDLGLLSFSEELVEARMGYQTRQLIKLLVGTPAQSLKVKLSTAICGIWLLDKNTFHRGFDAKSSESFERMGIDGKVDFTHGELAKENMHFAKVPSNKKVPFLLVTKIDDASKIPQNYDGLLGFGFQCRSSSQGNINLIQYFIGSGKVRKDIFAYTLDSKSGKGMFTFGGYPNKLDQKNKHYRTIPLDKYNTNGHWEVNLHSIFFENGMNLLVNAPLSIGIGGYALGVSRDVFDYLAGAFFYDDMNNRKCVMTKEDVWEIFCDLDYDITKVGVISLVLGKWNLKIPPTMLFKKVKIEKTSRLWFTVVFYEQHQGQFYLSQALLGGINTVVYDREKYEIGVFEGEMVKPDEPKQ